MSGSRDTTELSVPSDPRFMAMVRDVVSEFSRLSGFSDEECKKIALAVNEGCTNIIKYSYGDDYTKKIVVTCRAQDGAVEVRLRDFGKKGDPAEFKSRDLNDVKPGGLGVHLMQSIMDEVEYDVTHLVGTELRLLKQKGKT